jgi:hypothetical protein
MAIDSISLGIQSFLAAAACAVAQYENERGAAPTHKGDLETLEIFISARSKQAPAPAARAEL